MMEEGYYRFPTVSQDTVVFCAEDDLWQVSRTGGTARRLTNGWGSVSRPRLSPDGKMLAFVGKEEGDLELYVMESSGGPAKRLTYMGAGVATVGWHPDGRIIFSTYQGNPFLAWRSLYAIAPEGGEPELLPYGRASWISFGPDGGVVLGRPTTDSAYWKRYRGGTRGMLWIDADGHGTFHRFALEDGNIVTPMWIDERIYFVSDHEGHGNLYSMLPTGEDIRRHTDHDTYYVRNATTDGRHIVYHAGASLYCFDVASGESHEIPIDFHSQRTERQVKHVDAAEYWSEYTLSAHGDKLIVTSRGKLYQMAPFEGPVRPLGTPQGVRYRLTQYIDGEGRILTISDEDGEDRFEIRNTATVPEQVIRIPEDFGIVTECLVSPDGQFAALANERQELWLLDLKTLDSSRVAHTPYGRIPGFDWAPDSRWIAYALPSKTTTALYLYELATRQSHQITHPVLVDRRPHFDPEGRYLYFLSRRVYKPVWDNMKFDLSFPKGDIPCLIPLAKETRSPFIPEPQPLVPTTPGEKAEDDKPPVTTIDLDGIADRVLSFPVAEGIYHDIQAAPGQVFWMRSDPAPQEQDGLAAGAPPAKASLIRFDMKELKEDTVADRMTSFVLSQDRKVMAIRIRSSLRVIKVGDKVDPKEDKPGRKGGLVDFQRVHVSVDQRSEWEQMLREAWRWMREMFWIPDMAGVPWDAIYGRYRSLLPRVTTRSELSDLIWEMQGELGSSHAYEFGGAYRPEPQHRVGFLGARYEWNREHAGYQITHLIHGDSWDASRTSPLLTPGANVQVGDIITAIDGQPLGPDLPPGSRLIDTARQEVSVTVITPGEPPREIVVKPIATEVPARYREWVEQNRAYVHQRTGGRVGYIHVPNMGTAGFAEFHRGYLTEYERDGLIVDVRYNGGGIVSPLLLEMLGRKRIAFSRLRQGRIQPYPYESPTGAMVALTNEHAGSDGDIFSHSFKLMNLGPLIGTRTWGGVIGIDPRYALVDWGSTSQPEDAFWFKDVGLTVENYGTDPDIVVEETPQAMAQGIDEQLDRAIEEIQSILEDFHPLTPDFDNRPERSAPPLPKR
ncbi:S41 family peptidase [Sulfobacillus harzensis]|uniref:Tricorn protease homolog n=1 Tax=Sulfobacillus harzensis TaxID=2729629 RepID=A0A7Y0L5I1_9FIRM|nr:S41 family peptidase [Sulfobacillus harzensis]NMP23111.1 peptidase S41 [Sulfobacillus harzensis]